MIDLPESFEEFVSPAFCMHKDCGKPAEWALRIKIWAKGYSKENSVPLQAAFSLKVCSDHRNEVDPKTFWLPEAKKMVSDALTAMGRAEPDFDTTEFSWDPLRKLS